MSSSFLNTSASPVAVTDSADVRLRGGQYSLCVSASLPVADATVPAGGAGAPFFTAAAAAFADPIASGCPGDRGVLQLQLQSLTTSNVWAAELDSEYVELITKKTGNYKRFPVLVEMLITALKQDSRALSLDLLTQEDFATLKSGDDFASRRSANTSEGDAIPGSKRYLVLTYNTTFDRVHYPLPLTYQSRPIVVEPCSSSDHARQTAANAGAALGKNGRAGGAVGVTSVARELRILVDNLQAERAKHLEEIEMLRRLNSRLSHQLQESTAAQVATTESLNAVVCSLQEDNARLTSERQSSEAAFSRLHEEAEREVRCIQREFDDLCAEIEHWKAGELDGQGTPAQHRKSSKDGQGDHIKKLHKLLQGLIKELHRTKAKAEKALSQKTRHIEELSAELDVSRMTEKSLRARCKELSEKNQNLRASTEFNPVLKSRPIRAAIRGTGGDGPKKPRAPAQRAWSSRAGAPVSPPKEIDRFWCGRRSYISPYAQRSPSRHQSAGSPARFDPTEYVRQRKRVMEERRARSLSAGRVFRTGILPDTFRDSKHENARPAASGSRTTFPLRQLGARSVSAGASKPSRDNITSGKCRPASSWAHSKERAQIHDGSVTRRDDLSLVRQPSSKESWRRSPPSASQNRSRHGAEAGWAARPTYVPPGRKSATDDRRIKDPRAPPRHISEATVRRRQPSFADRGSAEFVDESDVPPQRRRLRTKRAETRVSSTSSGGSEAGRKDNPRQRRGKGGIPPVGGAYADDSEDIEDRLKALQAYLLSQRAGS